MEDEFYCTQNGHFLDEMSEEALRVLQGCRSQLKIMHLNTQCMTSTFDEFLLTVNKYPVNIITMSETWLRDNAALLNYVSVPKYASVSRNRESIGGGGVGSFMNQY